MSAWATEARVQRVEKIKNAASFLDAVFLMHYHRTSVACFPFAKITPEEIFGTFSESEFTDCLRRCEDLISLSSEIGNIGHASAFGKPLDQAIERMTHEHPGFSDECYRAVIDKGLFEMR